MTPIDITSQTHGPKSAATFTVPEGELTGRLIRADRVARNRNTVDHVLKRIGILESLPRVS